MMGHVRVNKPSLKHSEYLEFLRKQRAKLKYLTHKNFRADEYPPKRPTASKVVFTKPYHNPNQSFNTGMLNSMTLTLGEKNVTTIFIQRQRRWPATSACTKHTQPKSTDNSKENRLRRLINLGQLKPNATTRNTVACSTLSTAKNDRGDECKQLGNAEDRSSEMLAYYKRHVRVFARKNIRIIPIETHNKSTEQARTYSIDNSRTHTSNDFYGLKKIYATKQNSSEK